MNRCRRTRNNSMNKEWRGEYQVYYTVVYVDLKCALEKFPICQSMFKLYGKSVWTKL